MNDLDFVTAEMRWRDFIDGTNLKLKSFKSTIIVDIGQDHLKNIVPGYVYNSGEAIDEHYWHYCRYKGAVQVGLQGALDTGAWCI